jgi:hypothetical protein
MGIILQKIINEVDSKNDLSSWGIINEVDSKNDLSSWGIRQMRCTSTGYRACWSTLA